MATVSNSKRLAKNTIYMYIRMIFLMVLSLYMSRVLLSNLGVKDFGIYNVVGSFVAIFGGLKILFATATQRFLNYEMGRGNNIKLNSIFNTSIIVNAIIAVVFVLILEGAGLWFFNGRINVDPDRVKDAYIVFQLSILTAIISIMTIPYDAVILAHERMNFYAIISVIEGILKLFAALALVLFLSDRLVLYSIFLLIVSLLIRIIESIYCSRYFEECKLNLVLDRPIFKEMMSFSWWQLMGNTAYAISQHGINVVFNIFGGPIVNAARGLSLQVFEATNRFLTSITIVANPYSVKKYAEGDSQQMYKAMFFLSKLLFIIQLLMALPLTLFTEEILLLWLGKVPQYTPGFVRLILLYSVFRSLHGPIDIVFKAVGNIRLYQVVESILLVMPVVLGYLYLFIQTNYYMVFVLIVIFEIINLMAILVLASRICKMRIWSYFTQVAIPCLICLMIMFSFSSIVYYYNNLPIKLLVLLLSFIVVSLYMYYGGFSRSEISIIKSICKK